MTPFIAVFIAGRAVAGAICAHVAERKNRSVAGWFALSALLGFVVPLAVLYALAPLPKQEWQP